MTLCGCCSDLVSEYWESLLVSVGGSASGMRLVSYLKANPEEIYVCAFSPRAEWWVHHHRVCLQPSLVLKTEHVALEEVHLRNTLPRVHITSNLQRRTARLQTGSTGLNASLLAFACNSSFNLVLLAG